MTKDKSILLSVIVRIVGGGEFLERCIGSLLQQQVDQAVEIIVPYDATVKGINTLADQYPQVTFLYLGELLEKSISPDALHDLYDLRSAAGIRSAKGQIIAQIEDYCIPGSNWCEQILLAHELPYAAIGGAVEHQGVHSINWATYFLDFSRYQLPLSEDRVQYLTDVNISYKAQALREIKTTWINSYNEVRTNWALLQKGEILWRRPQIVVYQDRGKLTFLKTIAERYFWGKIFGRIRSEHISWLRRFGLRLLTPVLPTVMTLRIGKKVFASRRNRSHFLRALGYIYLFASFWAIGEFVGYGSK